MSTPNLAGVLLQAELCRSTVDSALQQLKKLEAEIRRLSRGDPKAGRASALERPRATSKIRVPEGVLSPARRSVSLPEAIELQRLRNRPADSELSAVTCPECRGAMVWRQNTQLGTFFAGCENFRGRNGCRGTRTRAEVDAGNAADRDGETHRAETLGQTMTAARHIATDPFNTILEKHHGTGAVLEQYQTGLDGSLLVDREGRPIHRDAEDVPF
jgi:hypothetical protein